MSDTKTKNLFKTIDEAIQRFITGKWYEVDNKSKSDWLVFDWRQIRWKEKDLNYFIEIYPEFDGNENIKSWNLYSCVWYDNNDSRFLTKKFQAYNLTLECIANQINELLLSAESFVKTINKADIPLALDFS